MDRVRSELSACKQLQNGANSSQNPTENDFSSLMPPPLTPTFTPSSLSFESPRLRALKHVSVNDHISPSKEGELSMDYSPCVKSPTVVALPRTTTNVTSDSNNSVYVAQLNSSAISNRTDSLSSLPLLNDSDSDSEKDKKDEMQPGYIFSISPGSPRYGIDYNEVPTEVFEITSLRPVEVSAEKHVKHVRRWRSQELRKRLLDMSNTPPCGYSSRRSLFKPPTGLDCSAVCTPSPKRQRDGEEKSRESEGCSTPKSSRSVPVVTRVFLHSKDEYEYHQRIKTAVDALQCPDLISDGTRCYCLPVIPGKHSDLKNIEPSTLVDLLKDKYIDRYEKLTIIDCRYPYEYQGGHIKIATAEKI